MTESHAPCGTIPGCPNRCRRNKTGDGSPVFRLDAFSDTPTKDTETVFRKPFTPEELKAIVDAAKDDDFIRPIIVTGTWMES